MLELLLIVAQSAHPPLSHADIKIRLESTGANIDRVTVYRILDSLVAAGLCLKAADSRGVFRFSATEARVAHGHHAHFRCGACGGVFCLDAPLPSAPKLPAGFRLQGVELDMHGTCARCDDVGDVSRGC